MSLLHIAMVLSGIGFVFSSPLISNFSQIVGGEDVVDGSIPYQVALYLNDSFYCAGTLVAERTVLTAAQCVHKNENNPSLFKIHYGSLSHQKGNQLSVSKIVKHPKFTLKQIEYDLAILHLQSQVQISKNTFPIQVAERTPGVGSSVSISGWGTLRPNGDFPNVLQLANTLKVVPTEYCKQKWMRVFNITKGVLCAESQTQSACHWDSGGPVTQNGFLVGVISFGSKRCLEPGTPNGYADIAHHRQWILENILQ